MFGKRLAALCTFGLLGLLASQTAQPAGKATCQLKILKFAQLAYVSRNGTTSYQFAISLWAGAPEGNEVNVTGGMGGGGGDKPISGVRNMQPGVTSFVAWTSDDSGGDHSHEQELSLELRCMDSYGQNERYDSASRSTHLYRPREPQPLVQPWVNGCPDQLVVDSRGSDETQGVLSPPGEAFANELRVQFYSRNFLGSNYVIASLANPYPAVGDWLKYFQAKLKLPLAYHQSVVAGKNWLRFELNQLARHCPRTHVILSGYSQGAQVSGDVYQERTWPNVQGMVLFGDPSFNPVDSSAHGGFDRQPHGPLGRLYHGSLHQRRPFNRARVWSFCHQHDPVCQGLNQLKYLFTFHDNYHLKGEPELAANRFSRNP